MTSTDKATSQITVDLVLIEPVKAFGGTERHTIGLIHELLQRGLRTAFIESGKTLVSSRINAKQGALTVITTNLTMSPKSKQESEAWIQLLRKFKTDRVLIIKPWHATGNSRFYKLLRENFAQIISIEHTTAPARIKWSTKLHIDRRVRTGFWWYKNYYELKMRANLIDRVITVSEFNKVCLINNSLVPSTRITVCPNGIDITVWQKDSVKARRFREQCNLPDDAFIFGCIGRLAREKGFELAIDAFIEFQKENSENNSYLVVIGEGEMRNELEKRARNANGKILFTGFMNDLVPAYSAISVGLFTSHHEKIWSGESFGLTLIEAMSCECGVIAMNKGATTEVIGECSDACELLETRDVDTWSLAMSKYANTSQDIFIERGAKLRKRVLDHYDASSTNARLVDVIMTA